MFPDVDTGGISESDSRQADVGERMMREHVKARRKEVDEEDILDGLALACITKPKSKKPKRSTKQVSDAEDTTGLSSDSHASIRSGVSTKNSRSSKPSKVIKLASSPEGKENLQGPSSSQTSKASAATGRPRPRLARKASETIIDVDATPKPVARIQKKDVIKPSSGRPVHERDINLRAMGKAKHTGLSKPLEIARSRQVSG